MSAFGAAAEGPNRPAPHKQPWEWTDQERFDALTDDAQAAARVQADRARKPKAYENQPPGAMQRYDVIDGETHPHLFFRVELFEFMARAASADELRFRELYQEMREEARINVGLPDDFWLRLEAITAAYRADFRRYMVIGSSDLPPAQRDAELNALEPLLCRGRHAALAEAEREFGPALDKFLYTAVARPRRASIYRKPDEKYRRHLMGDCR